MMNLFYDKIQWTVAQTLKGNHMQRRQFGMQQMRCGIRPRLEKQVNQSIVTWKKFLLSLMAFIINLFFIIIYANDSILMHVERDLKFMLCTLCEVLIVSSLIIMDCWRYRTWELTTHLVASKSECRNRLDFLTLPRFWSLRIIPYGWMYFRLSAFKSIV